MLEQDYQKKMEAYRAMVESALTEFLPADGGVVGEAMRYAVQIGGKRIRPILVLSFCEACGKDPSVALPFACALEMIHTYSLIHDDLPCMDDDDLRRGKPACHKQFGEANALLAGDGLLTHAFTVLQQAALSAEVRSKATALLAEAAGYAGMIGGQMMDLANEGKTVSLDTLRQTELLKTGALIRVACQLGCLAGGATPQQMTAAAEFAEKIGLAFQVVDDILDVTAEQDDLGKPIGSDAENQKCTYVSLLGLEQAQVYADSLTDEGKAALQYWSDTAFLEQLADQLCVRKK